MNTPDKGLSEEPELSLSVVDPLENSTRWCFKVFGRAHVILGKFTFETQTAADEAAAGMAYIFQWLHDAKSKQQ